MDQVAKMDSGKDHHKGGETNSATAILIQNMHNRNCLTIQDLKTSYPSDHPINAQWQLGMDICNAEDVNQAWSWSESSGLVHQRTGLHLSSTSGSLPVLVVPEDQLPSASRWQCNGFHIEQPQTSRCLTAITITDDRALDLEQALLSALSPASPPTMAEVRADPCDASNGRQQWSLYRPAAPGGGTPPVSACNREKSHAALECDIKKATPTSWTRCENHGYFVSGFLFDSATLRHPVHSLVCCKSPYTFWSNRHLQDTTDILCSQYPGQGGSYRCPKGQFLRGVLQGATEEMRIECCLPQGQGATGGEGEREYSYCYPEARVVDGLHACLSRKYHIVGVKEVCSTTSSPFPDTQCSLEMTCCI